MITPGSEASIPFLVDDESTAEALGSGDIPVLATPKLVALVEAAAVTALAGSVPSGSTSVGTNITLDHLGASSVGTTIVATATVTAVDGRNVSFDVSASDGSRVVARGTHTRVVVDRLRFLESSV